MTATDELRRLLDERGIVWMDVRRPIFLRTCWKTGDADVYCYFDEEKSTGVFGLSISGYDFTPEQAIAATLGNSTLTADDVLNAVYKHGAHWQAIADELNVMLGNNDDYEAKMDALLCRLTNGKWSKSRAYDLDFMVSCIDEEYEKLYEKECATLGTPERTCHIEERYIDWYCDACFEMVGTCDTTSELFIDGNAIKLWNYCPYCGAKVVEQ